MLVLLDWFFIVFHTALLLFNGFGWACRRTRRLHLVTMGLTAASWIILGTIYGTGYCICTDLHWQVRAALGRPIHDDTYVQFLLRELTGVRVAPGTVTVTTGVAFAISAVLTLVLNLRDRHVRQRAMDLKR